MTSHRRDPSGAPPRLTRQWDRLCDEYLPIIERNSIWRFSRTAHPGEPEQGWKLHVSATVLSACSMLDRIAPYLASKALQFKAPVSLQEVHKLNSGLHYNYSQIGKLVTVYTRSPAEAIDVAHQLHKLTIGIKAPSVPFDYSLGPDSCVYYRYGGFRSLTIENPDGTSTAAIRDPNGILTPDSRENAKPPWIKETLLVQGLVEEEYEDSPLRNRYRVVKALSQRGKGGVYEAIDISSTPPRLCILKEGRYLGEVSWNGRDGAARVRNEKNVLRCLGAAGIPVPEIYGSFRVKRNQYLATEYIQGETVLRFLLKRRRRLGIPAALRLASQFASLVAAVHAAGWTWRDCKPSNVIIAKGGVLRPIDFEGACPTDQPDQLPWSTPSFTPPKWKAHVQSRDFEDLYALGSTLFLFLTGRLLENNEAGSIHKLRRDVPSSLTLLISELLTAEPSRQPSARRVAKQLLSLANEHKCRISVVPVTHSDLLTTYSEPG